jgi:S1-C subfamily serine protease
MLLRMKRTLLIIVAVITSLALYTWSVVAFSQEDDGVTAEAPVEAVNLEQADEAPPPSHTAEVVHQVLPSVVNVRVTSVQFDPITGETQGRGQGSGVVIAKDGIIVTNFHVVSQAVDVEVALSDGRELKGEVIGAAPENDLAVIRVEADDLVPMELGNSDSLRLGDDVIAIGFPLDLGGATVTKGIVSAKNRRISPQGGSTPLRLTGILQTDAAINPGNSGGALVDANGRLVGINSAAAGAATAENIGFAIPIDEVVPVIEEILSEPPEQRAWIGIDISVPLTPEAAAQLGLPVSEGVLVAGTFDGSPAEEAGIERGDVIVSVDGSPVASSADLADVLGRLDPGDEVEIRLVNSSGERTVTVELDQRPAEFSLPEE